MKPVTVFLYYRNAHFNNVNIGNCISSWKWRKKDLPATIIGVDEFSSHNSNMLVMAISTTTTGFLQVDSGLICLYNPVISRMVKMIELPFTPTFISTMTTDGGPTATPVNFGNAIRLFFGTVAIGANDGSVYILDMAIDDQSITCDEDFPRTTEIIEAGSAVDYARIRSTARKYHTHLCLRLGGIYVIFLLNPIFFHSTM